MNFDLKTVSFFRLFFIRKMPCLQYFQGNLESLLIHNFHYLKKVVFFGVGAISFFGGLALAP